MEQSLTLAQYVSRLTDEDLMRSLRRALVLDRARDLTSTDEPKVTHRHVVRRLAEAESGRGLADRLRR